MVTRAECIITHVNLLTEFRFLLARKQTEELIRNHPSDMDEALLNLPTDMQDAYKKVIHRLKTRGATTRKAIFQALSWIYYAERQLKFQELLAVLEAKHATVDYLYTASEGLLEYEETTGIVRFSHIAINTYFQESPNRVVLLPCSEIALGCLKYLKFAKFTGPCGNRDVLEQTRLADYRFSQYATEFWGSHTRGEAEEDPKVQSAALTLFNHEKQRDSVLEIQAYIDSRDVCFTRGQTILHISARHGVKRICQVALAEMYPTRRLLYVLRMYQANRGTDYKVSMRLTNMAAHLCIMQSVGGIPISSPFY